MFIIINIVNRDHYPYVQIYFVLTAAAMYVNVFDKIHNPFSIFTGSQTNSIFHIVT